MKKIKVWLLSAIILGLPGVAASDFTCSSSDRIWYMCDEDERDDLFAYAWGDTGKANIVQNASQPWLATYDCTEDDRPIVRISNTVIFNQSILVSSDTDPIKCNPVIRT
jgi:hypothetical protein